MKGLLNTSFFIGSIILISSCNDNKNPSKKVSANPKADTGISISFIGKSVFRRSYSGIQFIDDEQEIDRYLNEQEKSNPLFIYAENEVLKKRFQELGIVKSKELLLDKFKYNTKNEFQFIDYSGRRLNIQLERNPKKGSEYKIIVFAGQDSSEMKIDGFMSDLKHALLDIIPGGNKEIVFLSEYYIMNGNNFELIVYEIN